MGFGAVIMMFGLALIAPVLVRPMSGLIGRPLERFVGLTGQLARENTRRQPQRTAVTASALMIGLALVVFVTIFAAGLKATIDQGIDDQVRAAGIVKSVSFLPLPEGVTEALRDVDGVAAVSPIQFETGKLKSDGKNVAVTGVDPATVNEALAARVEPGLGEHARRARRPRRRRQRDVRRRAQPRRRRQHHPDHAARPRARATRSRARTTSRSASSATS